jgi:Na+/phosphate symporter
MAAVKLKQVPRDRQSQPSAGLSTTAFVHLIEALEDARRVPGLHADSGIDNLRLHAAALSASTDGGESGGGREFDGVVNEVHQLLNEVLQAYGQRDLEAAGRVWMQDDTVDELYETVFRHLIAGMIADRTTVREGTYLLWVAHNLERIADRVTNIAERIAFIVTGDVAAFRDELRAQTLPT